VARTGGQRFRGLVVGLGTMGGFHLRVLSSMPGVEVAGVVDPDPARRAAALHAHPGLAEHADLQSALASTEVDFACIAVPAEYLPELASATLDAGLPTLVEKPMAPTECGSPSSAGCC
jgi:predicted dehydrogenase